MKGVGNHVTMMAQQFQNGGQLHQHQHHCDIAPPPPTSQPPLLHDAMHGLTLAEVHYQDQPNTFNLHHHHQQQQLTFDQDSYHQGVHLYQPNFSNNEATRQVFQTADNHHSNHHHHHPSSAQTHYQNQTEGVKVSQSSNTGVGRLLEDLQRLLEHDRETADIVFLVGETPVYAHRVILKAR